MNELTLHLTDEAFEPVVADTEVTLQRLLRNMVDKDSLFGSLTIKVDIELTPVDVPNFDPSVRGDTRQVLIPKLSHKVSSVMQIKDEAKGNSQYDDYELAWDKELGEYVLKPIIAAQQSIFNTDYEATDAEKPDESPATPESRGFPLLTAHVDETPAPLPAKKGDRPFDYLRCLIGRKMRVFEALGNYTARTYGVNPGHNAVILSSAFSPTDPFYCPAEKLKPHLGHELVCGGEDEHGEERYADEGGQILKAFIVCTDCGDVLFSLNADGNETSADVDGEEPEDVSDMFDGYQYENPTQ